MDRRRNPLRVFYYRGAWHYSCWYGKRDSEYMPCTLWANGFADSNMVHNVARAHLVMVHVLPSLAST